MSLFRSVVTIREDAMDIRTMLSNI